MTDLKNLIIRLKNDHILEKKDFIRLLEGLPEILNPPNCWARKPGAPPGTGLAERSISGG